MTAYDMAQRFIGTSEVSGEKANPQIMTMLKLDGNAWTEKSGDETPWCSAFVNYVAWLMRLPRSKSLMARSWLTVGTPVRSSGQTARVVCDVVILKRGGGEQPGPEVLDAPGHVGFFGGLLYKEKKILLLGGNQGNSVSVSHYDVDRVLGIRRLHGEWDGGMR